MFETALAQLRYADSVLFAIPFDLRSLDKLIDGILATQQEFDSIGPYGAELLGGPELDEETAVRSSSAASGNKRCAQPMRRISIKNNSSNWGSTRQNCPMKNSFVYL
jgi:hypothetical protein